ncbi:MAG: bifunctional (p)ppGpp synthetase/guanosine-3',5'-bis(diphosphate) 3'-pyrophosphohydrolase [Casimicrobiaceae bacterium]|nr:bifunctional (p)ppGpp synthetase/guanosine-3',5'-bis(diphosphate) 3'-pyrophosphohydrolase [Casimicrobiaceae bacterium]
MSETETSETSLRWLEGELSATDRARMQAAAQLAARLKLDAASESAAEIAVLPESAAPEERLRAHCSPELVQLVLGVRRMATLQTLYGQRELQPAERSQHLEALRKMLLAMAEDVRVVVIKLIERVVSLRTVARSPDARRGRLATDEARLALEIFAPLANRLGIWQLKWELEDLSFRLLDPERYHAIARYLDETRIEREAYIDTAKAILRDALMRAGIEAEVSGRPKHIYSIHAKMQRKRCTIEELYDIRALRVVVSEVRDCYSVLGIVHGLWQPIPGEFDDYIAKPKANGYKSLHTSVIGPGGRALEVQIRTHEMHQMSEYGVAAHWGYKEGGAATRDAALAAKLAHLRQMLSWGDELASPGELLAGFKSSLFEDTIFVLTPQGKIIDLPKNSTPIDFAYAVHTSLGHRCRGAKVDGAMVPLNTPLKNGQRVEIIAAKEGGPSRDWLNPDLGYLHSNRARAKVRQWFNALDLAETLAQGRATVERELHRLGQDGLNLERLAHEAGFKTLDELLLAVGRAEITQRELDQAIRRAAGVATSETAPDTREVHTAKTRATGSAGGILIVGVDKLMTGLARCCKPVPPDPIVGFVTRLKGITIHRMNCPNVARLEAREPGRLVAAEWGAQSANDLFSVTIEVIASDRQGLLRDVSDVLARERINVTAVNTLTRDLLAKMKFTAEVKSLAQLDQALRLVRQVKGVQSARRI